MVVQRLLVLGSILLLRLLDAFGTYHGASFYRVFLGLMFALPSRDVEGLLRLRSHQAVYVVWALPRAVLIAHD